MSVLNINELKLLAKNNNLLGLDYKEANFQPSSYDLRIGAIFKDNEIFSKDFEKQGFTNNIDIKPSEIVSILTLEKVTIPSDCIGTVFAVNRQSSTGLLILNPGHVDPGFSGSLSICAINLSQDKRTISIGESIFTLIVQKLNTELKSEELFENKTYTSRKEEEQFFLKNKSKKLSNSFFDLITGYDGAKKLLTDRLIEKFWKYIMSFAKIIAVLAGLAGIIRLGYVIAPNSMFNVNRQVSKPLYDSTFVKQKDSIIQKQNVKILNLQDSLNRIKKFNKAANTNNNHTQ